MADPRKGPEKFVLNPGCFQGLLETLSGTRENDPKRDPESFRAREVFGSFEKRTPGPGCSKLDYVNPGLARILIFW